jgi:hypothetical protein
MAKGQRLKETGTGLGGPPNAGSGKRFTCGYGPAALAFACGIFVPDAP